MRRVAREEVLDFVTYDEQRESRRARVLEEKALRRVHLGDHLTLLFENTLTVWYQIQEMLRAERIVREADVQHEIATYNELLGADGELGCTLLIEIDDPPMRAAKLREWWPLPERLYVVLEDGTRIPARFDERQRGEGKLSAVQYLKFAVGGRLPVAVGVDLPALRCQTRLDEAQRAALGRDLAGDA
jgi:hypothetical protein